MATAINVGPEHAFDVLTAITTRTSRIKRVHRHEVQRFPSTFFKHNMKMFLKTMVTQLIEDDRTEITRHWTGPGQMAIAIVEQTWPDIEKDIAEFDVKQLHAT